MLLCRYAADTRYSVESVASHDHRLLPALPCRLLSEIPVATWSGFDVVAIDEGQFFADLVEFSEMCANAGKIVIIAALDGDFRRKPFGRVLELIPMAERIDKLTAVCTRCCSDAAFTQRTVASTEIELIGGAESYRPVCRACFNAVATGASLTAPLSPPSLAAAKALALSIPQTPLAASPSSSDGGSPPEGAPTASRATSAVDFDAKIAAAASAAAAAVGAPEAEEVAGGFGPGVKGGGGNSSPNSGGSGWGQQPLLTPTKG